VIKLIKSKIQFRSSYLISLGQSYNNDCDVHLNKDCLQVYKNNKVIYKGIQNITDGLWDINLTNPIISQNNNNIHKTNKLNVIIRKNTLKTDFINFLNACCFSPTKQSFIKAIQKGNLITFSGLTEKLLNNFKPICCNCKRTFRSRKKNLQTTQIKEEDHHQDVFPHLTCLIL
jgi:hypothetical protein